VKGVVVDASMALSWCFEDEHDELSDRVLTAVRQEGAIVTPLWWLEISNALIQAETRGRLTTADAVAVLALLDRLPLEMSELDPAPAHLLALARTHGLTSYDASYLIAAEQYGCHLATRDRRLADAARAEGVPLIE